MQSNQPVSGIQMAFGCFVFQPAKACVRMVKNDKNALKLSKTYSFHHVYERLMLGLHRNMKENEVF